GKVIGIPGRIAGDRLDVGRTGGGLGVLAGLAAIRGAAPIAAAGVFGPGKIDVVGDDLHCGAVVAVFVLVLPGLDAAVNDDQAALLEILADKIGLAAPRHHVQKIGLALLALAGKVAVAGNAEAGHIDAAGGGAELGVR